MSGETTWLLLAGVGAGLTGSVAGLASLVSYPALLAVGLPPLTANVTNTVALFGVTGGTVAGSRRELRGQGRRILGLATISILGGASGAAVLLNTSDEAFQTVVPWLIASGALLLLLRDRIQTWATNRGSRRSNDVTARHRGRRALGWGFAVFVLGWFTSWDKWSGPRKTPAPAWGNR